MRKILISLTLVYITVSQASNAFVIKLSNPAEIEAASAEEFSDSHYYYAGDYPKVGTVAAASVTESYGQAWYQAYVFNTASNPFSSGGTVNSVNLVITVDKFEGSNDLEYAFVLDATSQPLDEFNFLYAFTPWTAIDTYADTDTQQTITVDVSSLFPAFIPDDWHMDEEGFAFLLREANSGRNYGSTIYGVVSDVYVQFSLSPVAGNTPTPENTPTPTATRTMTPDQTYTPSNTPTATNTPTASNTPTNTYTPSNTPTSTNTPTNTATPTSTPTFTNSPTPLATATRLKLLGMDGRNEPEEVKNGEIDYLYVQSYAQIGSTTSNNVVIEPNRIGFNIEPATTEEISYISDATAQLVVSDIGRFSVEERGGNGYLKFVHDVTNSKGYIEWYDGTNSATIEFNSNGVFLDAGNGDFLRFDQVSSQDAFIFLASAAKDGSVSWDASANRLNFRNSSDTSVGWIDFDDGAMDIEGRLTVGSTGSTLTYFQPAAEAFPEISSGAPTVNYVPATDYFAPTDLNPQEIVVPCPFQTSNTVVSAIRLFFYMDNSSEDFDYYLYTTTATTMGTTTVTSETGKVYADVTSVGSVFYYDIPAGLPVTNSTQRVWLRIVMDSASGADDIRYHGALWTFREVGY